jgi:hypothetical protein
LLDLLLDYDALAPRILDGALGEVLARATAREEAAAADQTAPMPAPVQPADEEGEF